MENQNFDEFDIMAARDWVSAVIRNHKDRLSLERLNNQIRLAKEDSGVRMMEGIEALADLLGVKLRSRQVREDYSYTYFYHLGTMFFMDDAPDFWRYKS